MLPNLLKIVATSLLAATVLSVVAAGHVYFYRRLVRAHTRRPGLQRVGKGALGLLALLLVAGPVGQRAAPGEVTVLVGKLAYLWMAVGFYLLVTLGFLDLVRLVERRLPARASRAAPDAQPPAPCPERRQFLAQTGLFGAAVALPTSGFGWWRAFGPPEVTETRVALPGLPRSLSGLTIAHLTDIHVGAWIDRSFVAELVARTNALRPDLVAITGDLVDGSVAQLAAATAPLAELRSRFGTFFVLGNHEYYSGADPWAAHLRAMGMQVLRNQRVAVEGLDLCGVEDWSTAGRGYPGGYDLEAALAGRDPERPALLLAHQPRGFEGAAARGVGLQLSGHTHGGQMFPWTLAVRLAYHPYCAGLYRHGRSHLYVSRGCGFWGPPVRVGAPPEIARIVLT